MPLGEEWQWLRASIAEKSLCLLSTLEADRGFARKKCRDKWDYKNPKYPPVVCKYCGRKFIPKEANRTTYCSRECAFADKRAKVKPRAKPVCIVCGKEFEGRLSRKFCSEECRRTYYAIKAKQYYYKNKSARAINPVVKKKCAWCGEEFETNYYASRRIYCSATCRETAYKFSERARQRMEVYRKKRNERIAKQLVERFSYADIARRDGWRCHICGKKINPKLKWPHPMAPTFDHLIPIADGGQHVMSNVRLAHFICNARRTNIGPAQLVLDLRL